MSAMGHTILAPLVTQPAPLGWSSSELHNSFGTNVPLKNSAPEVKERVGVQPERGQLLLHWFTSQRHTNREADCQESIMILSH